MTDKNDALPSDQEDGGLKPTTDKKPDAPKPAPDSDRTKEDPSEQPS